MPKILIVDDSRLVTVMLSDGLSKEGYEVLTALDAAQGLKMVRETNPPIVILDVQMPVMNGYEFVEILRKEPGRRVPSVIMLTGDEVPSHPPQTDVIKAYFQKPVTIPALSRKIKECLEAGVG